MDPLVAVFNVRIAIHKGPDTEVKEPTANDVETACESAVAALFAVDAAEGGAESAAVTVNAEATRTDE